MGQPATEKSRTNEVCAVDLFCGAGGLTLGLKKAGIRVLAGIDSDPACAYPYDKISGASFIEIDIRAVRGVELAKLYPKGAIKLLAGCAPCKPFSSLRRKASVDDDDWSLLKEFGRVAQELEPELITMENVPRLGSKQIFKDFLASLNASGYTTDWASVYCPKFGIPQRRRRLVLLASRIGKIAVPAGQLTPRRYRTVRDAISCLPKLVAGGSSIADPLHRARSLTKLNLDRLRASKPGGTWLDWPLELRASCHQRKSGASYRSVYSRMEWDKPAPTITTQAFNFGTGRFGHPEQDRAITLREAAILQTFPRRFAFVRKKDEMSLTAVGRLIGNAVPPQLAFHVGKELLRVAQQRG